MTSRAIDFLQHWMSEKLPKPAGPAEAHEMAPRLVARCSWEANLAGISVDDIQEEVGSLEDLIVVRLGGDLEGEAQPIQPANDSVDVVADEATDQQAGRDPGEA